MGSLARWFMAVSWVIMAYGVQAQSVPAPAAQGLAQPAPLQFLDLPRFDTTLAAALNSAQPQVEVTFYNKVSPNQLPQRLQKWLTAIEQSGGALDVAPPPGDLAPRNPVLLLGLLGGLWSTLKAWGEIKESHMLQAAAGHHVTLQLNRSADGEIVIERLVFHRVAKAL
ncbi:hypothetical protein PSQ20_17850 [Curvibacter sp. RS43]|uniref:hypothetical protein n=1 Tax=Curvibacter microcysteis TaxID=3026419 RepID=UPI00235F77BA|nr:hypothetical protein [Curvibacter sp. RS43]MDD0812219.1 hypothetical protein [Curvibacter sp. RS43]